MKKVTSVLIAVSAATLFVGCDNSTGSKDDSATAATVIDSINVDYKGDNYAVFYSLESQRQLSVKHDVWDIAVDGSLGLKANSGDYGVGVTVFPTEATDFKIDMSTYADSSFDAIENRSFEDNDPFKGWMSYNPSTHAVAYAENLFVIKDESGSFYKVQFLSATKRTGVSITVKIGGLSDTDASEIVFTKESDYDKVYIDLGSKAAVSFAPKTAEWDLKFARGEQKVENQGVLVPYGMSAISINTDNSVQAYVVTDKILKDVTTVNENGFSDSINVVGNSWYTFDSKTFTFSADKDVSVIKTEAAVYKLQMSTFGKGFNSIFEFEEIE